MPCNAKVVLTAKVKIIDRYKYPIDKQIQLNALVSVIIDKYGTAIFKYIGDSWEQGTGMIGAALIKMSKEGTVFDSIGQPETHRHSEVGHQQMVTH